MTQTASQLRFVMRSCLKQCAAALLASARHKHELHREDTMGCC